MKRTIAILATLVIVAAAAPACAQDWVMDWTSQGHVAVIGGDWRLSGESPASFIGSFAPLPPTFAGPSTNLVFTANGQSYGGLVTPGQLPNFQTDGWAVPASGNSILFPNGTFTAGFASGTLTFTNSNTFSLDVLVGSGGHDFAEFEATGHRATAATLEPATLTVGAIGLLGAALVRRRRHTS